ncbi:MAG: T9SS type A sorting domain-containing protein [Lewinellaceae bacterium]|nr:T9SS type A sorting domain-containing protein [Lewinellaceae bacterium]
MQFWKSILPVCLLLATSLLVLGFGQQPAFIPTSIHQEEQEHFHQLGILPSEWEAINKRVTATPVKKTNDCQLTQLVFGWHPYWSNGLEQHYDWGLLSDLSYFSYELDPVSGQARTTNNWTTAAVVSEALSQGVRVSLCVTLFANHGIFLRSAQARQTLIDNLIALLQQRGAQGINIDFEAIPVAERANFTAFIRELNQKMRPVIPGFQLSMAIPAVDWSAVFEVTELENYVDLFILMGYDYYWSGSTQAGPTDPLYRFQESYNYNLSRSVTYYRQVGIPAGKLLLGLPYYGREWETQGPTIPATTTKNFQTARTYRYVRDHPETYRDSRRDLGSMSTYYSFQSGDNWRQCFINSPATLEKRLGLVRQRGLAGIGIWALGYDAGYPDYWEALLNNLTTCAMTPCIDTLYDGGGPLGNYYANEFFTQTITTPANNQVVLQFNTLNLGTGDTLWIYNGNRPAEELLLRRYTGAHDPESITSSDNHLTLVFRSNASQSGSGWEAIYQCGAVTPVTENNPVIGRLSVFPNPATAQCWVSYDLQQSGFVYLVLLDAQGRIVWQLREEQPAGHYNLPLELPVRANGAYFLRLFAGQQALGKRIVIVEE